MDFKDLKAAISDDILTEFCESLHNTSSQCVYTIGKFYLVFIKKLNKKVLGQFMELVV